MRKIKWLREVQAFLNVDCRLPGWIVYPWETFTDYLHYRQFKPGVIYHSCALHPCRATEVDHKHGDISGISLLDGSGPHNCSLTSCGVYIMKQAEIDEYMEAWNREGERGILKVYCGSEAEADELTRIMDSGKN